jgi:hypothetical protein
VIIFAAFESPAIIAGLNDVAVMDQPVEQRSGSVFERWRADTTVRRTSTLGPRRKASIPPDCRQRSELPTLR